MATYDVAYLVLLIFIVNGAYLFPLYLNCDNFHRYLVWVKRENVNIAIYKADLKGLANIYIACTAAVVTDMLDDLWAA